MRALPCETHWESIKRFNLSTTANLLTMSSTATSTTLQQDHLRDYDIQLTGSHSTTSGGTSTSTPEAPPQVVIENPPGWYDGHRQVPPYRPVNTHLDREQRPWGSNPVESAFVFHMLHGVWLRSVSYNYSWSG
jgi:hypothetical protein